MSKETDYGTHPIDIRVEEGGACERCNWTKPRLTTLVVFGPIHFRLCTACFICLRSAMGRANTVRDHRYQVSPRRSP